MPNSVLWLDAAWRDHEDEGVDGDAGLLEPPKGIEPPECPSLPGGCVPPCSWSTPTRTSRRSGWSSCRFRTAGRLGRKLAAPLGGGVTVHRATAGGSGVACCRRPAVTDGGEGLAGRPVGKCVEAGSPWFG